MDTLARQNHVRGWVSCEALGRPHVLVATGISQVAGKTLTRTRCLLCKVRPWLKAVDVLHNQVETSRIRQILQGRRSA